MYVILACLLLVALAQARTHYLPGVSPNSFEDGEDVKLQVSKLTSTKTQIPYEYYALPYCKPKHAGLQSENIGEALSGDRIENSLYQLEAGVNKPCEVAGSKLLTAHERDAFVQAIEDEYRVHWIVDNLPVGQFVARDADVFERGFPVGMKVVKAAAPVAAGKASSSASSLRKKESGTVVAANGQRYGTTAEYQLNNHIRIIISYNDDHNVPSSGAGAGAAADAPHTMRIVNFRVEAQSVAHQWSSPGSKGEYVAGKSALTTCSVGKKAPVLSSLAPLVLPTHSSAHTPVVFTYEVEWVRSATPWEHRWDMYIAAASSNERVHWFSISNSIVIVLFLSITIGTILVRALRKDIAQYNDPSSLEDAREESGWKLVHGDVFRPPEAYPMIFAVFVGSGIQLFLMTVATLFFALVGLLSPANRGSLSTGLFILFVCMGAFAGYYSSVTYKMFRGTDWRRNTLLTALLYPGIVFTGFGVLNTVLWLEGSSGAVPFSTFFSMLFLWFCVSVPLVVLGSFFGYKRETTSFPVRTNQIPRAIPPQSIYLHPAITTAVGGILPFGAVAVELYFIMSALWLHQIYYIFGFLFLVMIVLVVTCAEVAILMTYFQLCLEDYHWWWRSFITSGACAGYMLLYAVWYNLTKLNITGIVPTLIYFTYMALGSFTFFLVTGTIGFVAAFQFNMVIYGSIKVD